MAVRLQILCDPCQQEGTYREATTYPVTIAGQERLLDLCDDHAGVIHALQEMLRVFGRKLDAPVKQVGAASDGDKRQCPVCNKTFRGLEGHWRRDHQDIALSVEMFLAAREGRELKHKCDDCVFATDWPQALGAHRRQSHGVEGQSPKLVKARAAKAAKAVPASKRTSRQRIPA